MMLSEVIKKAQAALDKHGDLEVLGDGCYEIFKVKVVRSKGEFPPDWNMPAGFKFFKIESIR